MDGVQCVLIFLMGHYYGTFYNAEECVFEVFSWRNSYMMGSSARMVALCSVLKKNQEWKRSYSTFGFSHIIMRQTCNFYSLLHALMFSWRNIYKGKLLLILRGVRKFCRFFGTTTLYASPKKWRQKKYHFYSIEQLMGSLYGVSSTHLASHCYSLSPFKSFRGIGFHRCRQKELSSQILSLLTIGCEKPTTLFLSTHLWSILKCQRFY